MPERKKTKFIIQKTHNSKSRNKKRKQNGQSSKTQTLRSEILRYQNIGMLNFKERKIMASLFPDPARLYRHRRKFQADFLQSGI